MLYWWPKIKVLGIPVPKTILVPLNANLEHFAEVLGYPLFMRTDLCSGKHDWVDSCYVAGPEELRPHLQKVLESNIRWEMLGIKPQAVALRELITLETHFNAFTGNMPISRERRYFVKDGQVLCHHPYWPETAFNRHPARMVNECSDWQDRLADMNDETNENILTMYSEDVSMAVDGYWSIDFAKSKDGKWYLLDMALGENSYHWPGCNKKI